MEPLPIDKLRNEIPQVGSIDLRSVSIEQLKERLVVIFCGILLRVPFIQANRYLFRAVRWTELPRKVSDLSYPPLEMAKSLGRVNRPRQPVLYCSNAKGAALKEINVRQTETIAISKWRTKDRFLVNHVGYDEDIYRINRASDQISDWVTAEGRDWCDERSVLVERFLKDQFTRVVPVGSEHLYKMSVAIAEKRFEQDMFEGLMYPSIAASSKADNLVMKPEFADKRLEFAGASFLRIDAVDDETISTTTIDAAKTASPNGDIHWLGRPLHWVLKSEGEQLAFCVEKGEWVARDSDGRVVAPE